MYIVYNYSSLSLSSSSSHDESESEDSESSLISSSSLRPPLCPPSGPEDLAAQAGAAGVREQAASLIVQLLLGSAAAGVHRGARANGRGLFAEAPLAAGGAGLAVGRAKALHDGGLFVCAQRPQSSNQRVVACRDAAQEGRVAEGFGAGDALGRNLGRMEGSEGGVSDSEGGGGQRLRGAESALTCADAAALLLLAMVRVGGVKESGVPARQSASAKNLAVSFRVAGVWKRSPTRASPSILQTRGAWP